MTRLDQDLRDRSSAYNDLMLELRSLQRSCDEEIGKLKLSLVSKSDETLRIMHLYEDNMVLVKDLKLENEAMKQKVELLKEEYYKLETMHRSGNADIRAELAVSKERLGNYELIEKELD